MTSALVGRTYLLAVLLNFAWEMAQAPLFEPMGTAWQATRRCFIASLGDGVVVLLIVAIGAAVFRSGRWFVDHQPGRYAFASTVGLVLAIGIEQGGLATGRWAYQPTMPRLPQTDLGAVPIAQMIVLSPLILWTAAAWHSRRPAR